MDFRGCSNDQNTITKNRAVQNPMSSLMTVFFFIFSGAVSGQNDSHDFLSLFTATSYRQSRKGRGLHHLPLAVILIIVNVSANEVIK